MIRTFSVPVSHLERSVDIDKLITPRRNKLTIDFFQKLNEKNCELFEYINTLNKIKMMKKINKYQEKIVQLKQEKKRWVSLCDKLNEQIEEERARREQFDNLINTNYEDDNILEITETLSQKIDHYSKLQQALTNKFNQYCIRFDILEEKQKEASSILEKHKLVYNEYVSKIELINQDIHDVIIEQQLVQDSIDNTPPDSTENISLLNEIKDQNAKMKGIISELHSGIFENKLKLLCSILEDQENSNNNNNNNDQNVFETSKDILNDYVNKAALEIENDEESFFFNQDHSIGTKTPKLLKDIEQLKQQIENDKLQYQEEKNQLFQKYQKLQLISQDNKAILQLPVIKKKKERLHQLLKVHKEMQKKTQNSS
eukprot:TRINITY_DN3367_c1_g1_i1.p1 TRINITY_DN3367_c1_g1~~TRINITY_DN3367_c1_g1_i1.p1  ORF type:complete len:371 (-),score=102.60 TRINITY_DN3367_c1_g1_i1:25-1137(-)